MRREYRVGDRTFEVDEETEVFAVQLPAPVQDPPAGAPVACWQGELLVALDSGDAPEWLRPAFDARGWTIVRRAGPCPSDVDLPRPRVVGRLYRDEHGVAMIGAGRLTVQFAGDVAEERVEALLAPQGVRVLEKLHFAPSLYEVAVEGDADFLDVAQRLDRLEETIFAEPQMIRKVSRD